MGALKLQGHQLPALRVVSMQGDKLGIDNLKIVLEVVIIFMSDVIMILKKGNWLLFGQTVLKLLSYGNIVAIAQVAFAEMKDVSQAESEELTAHFAAKFDLENDDVERVIETAVAFVPKIYQLAIDAFDVVSRGRAIWEQARDLFHSDEAEEAALKVAA